MTDNAPLDPLHMKIFPRNLTARADYIVRGNPANTRPESGVDNCYPGLEFDQRNLDKAFFPGLVFEFHRDDGAILHRVVPGGLAAQQGLSDRDLPLYLWGVIGRTSHDQTGEDIPGFLFPGMNGLEVWRRVHDLLPGRVVLLLGPLSGYAGTYQTLPVVNHFIERRNSGDSICNRDEGGNVKSVILVGERARYLDEDGVIDADVYQPGDLTRSLCAPWQYDFRDCGCFYWAANKPDLVTSADGAHPYLNFQRKDRTSSPPQSDTVSFPERRDKEIDYAELIHAWNDLPVILNDQENEQFLPPPVPEVSRLMTRQEVIDELRYMATVEHALCVEYLYAHYSLNAPIKLPESGADAQTRSIFAAADEVFRVAVDEMRHLRWVNEALELLGEKPSVERATCIGRQLQREFSLHPLTPEQLDWFIEVEKPSQALNETDIDGMYVRLHTSIGCQPQEFPERDRLVHLIKLIIDEGEEHYERFTSVRRHLSSLHPSAYLRDLKDPPSGSKAAAWQNLSDKHYDVLLSALRESFSLGDRAGGVLLEQSRRFMFSLHETNHLLARNGARPRFELPPPPSEVTDRDIGPDDVMLEAAPAISYLDVLEASVRDAFATAIDVSGADEQAFLERQQRVTDELLALMRQSIEQDLQ